MIRMHKVNIGVLGHVAVDGDIPGTADFVPAHVGDFQFIPVGSSAEIEALYITSQDCQSVPAAVFITDVEEQVQAKTDTQKPFSLLDGILDGFDELFFAKGVDGVAEGADAGQRGEDGGVGVGDVGFSLLLEPPFEEQVGVAPMMSNEK